MSQATRWQETGHVWVDERERFDAMLEPYGERVISAATIGPGASVIDIGCGTGTTTLQAARESGDSGRVLGIDVSAPMIAEARRRAGDGIELVRADASIYAFEPVSADAVISRFGMMLFDDAAAAFANIIAALRPGGKLAFVTWQAAELNAWHSLPLQVAMRHVPELAGLRPAPGAPCPFSLADRDVISALVSGAGGDDVLIEPITADVWVGTDVDDVVDFVERGEGRALKALVDRPLYEEVLADLRSAVAVYQADDGIRLPSAAWLVTAVRR